MPMIELEALPHRWFEEVWNQGRLESIDELFAPNGIAHGLGPDGGDAIGPEGFKQFVHELRSLLSDIHVTVEDTLTAHEKVAARVVLRANYHGNAGAAPRPITISAISIVTVKNGQIVEAWNNWDQFGMMRQIGAIST